MTTRYFLAVDHAGAYVVDSYGDVIVWPSKDDAARYGTPVGAVVADHPFTGYRRGIPTPRSTTT